MKIEGRAEADLIRLIPRHMHQSFRAYWEEGQPPGNFLRAVLSNQLMEAYQWADEINLVNLREYVTWLYNHAPGRPAGWGSPEAVNAWVKAAYEARQTAETE